MKKNLPTFVIADTDEGSDFIKFLCASLKSEYCKADVSNKKRDLVQLFSYEVIPKVMRSSSMAVREKGENVYTVMQTPELRSMLTKKIQFQFTNSRSGITVVYDGKNEDKLFKIGQDISDFRKKISALLSNYSGANERQMTWYPVLLYTIYLEAKDESEVCQRAIAWAIRNKADKNGEANLGAHSIDKVCLERNCWKSFKKPNWNEDLEEIDRWLPNVFDELGGHDFSINSTDFNDSRTDIDLRNSFNYVTTVKIGNIQFYKDSTTSSVARPWSWRGRIVWSLWDYLWPKKR